MAPEFHDYLFTSMANDAETPRTTLHPTYFPSDDCGMTVTMVLRE